MRLRPVLISLPLVLCVSQAVKPVTYAMAAAMEASEAATLLAKSHAIDVKCGVLTKQQSQDLRSFVAKAEISLAEKASVAEARKAISGGRAAGKSAVCDDAAKKLVNDVFTAATAATTAPIEDATTVKPAEEQTAAAPASSKTPAPVVAPVEPIKPKQVAIVAPQVQKPIATTVKPLKPKVRVVAVAPAPVVKPVKVIKPVKTVKGLSNYALVAEKYYVAVRCGTMSGSRINSLYQTVLVNHKQAMASNRARDVRIMLKAAESRAGNKSCG